LAPTIASKRAQDDATRQAATALRKELGEDFESLTDELASVFSAPRQLDVLQAENPAALVRYLADPEHADEAEAIAAMSHFQAGRAIARLEAKIAAAKVEPKASKAPAPLEQIKGRGPSPSEPDDKDSIDVWVRKERARLAKLRGSQS
jgi:hypothetical protein